MRSRIVTPSNIKCFTEYLRAKGYYCTNRSKTDYQFEPPTTAWDRQGTQHGDWRGRGQKQPFFSVINLTVCHESQIRHSEKRHQQILNKLKPEQIHDPEKAGPFLPPYIPNTPEARKNRAWYQDNISEMDRQAGNILQKLEDDGLSDNTLVVFWSDHGQGMPRGKRWIYDSGTHVPVIMRWPGKLAAGKSREDLVSLIDLTATTLSVAGISPPEYMHGRVLIGNEQEQEPEFIFFHRDRMDEAYEIQRGARGQNFRYIRNFEPEKTYAQGIDYMDEMPAMKAWRRLNAQKKLSPPQTNWFAKSKPIEELYDCDIDPHNIQNLAADSRFSSQLKKFGTATENWQLRIGDLGMVPEPVLMETINSMKVTVVAPKIKIENGHLLLPCETGGASLTFRTKRSGRWSGWRLYPYRSQIESSMEQIEAKACRIGCGESKSVILDLQD